MDVSVSPLAVSAHVSGSLVVMTPDMRFIELDTVGGEIWELLSAGASVHEIAIELVNRYGIELPTAQSDTEQFVTYLADEGVVSISK